MDCNYSAIYMLNMKYIDGESSDNSFYKTKTALF